MLIVGYFTVVRLQKAYSYFHGQNVKKKLDGERRLNVFHPCQFYSNVVKDICKLSP